MIVPMEIGAELIKTGEVVAIPTETVYGLAADAFHLQAVRKTFQTKGRPADNPLIVHISKPAHLRKICSLNEEMQQWVDNLASRFWPGPLTLVLPKSPQLPDIVTGGLNTVAVRMPDHDLALQLIGITGPITAPSANRSGGPSPTKAQHVEDDYEGSIPVVDGGTCKIGLESTVLDITSRPFVVLRRGSVGAVEIEKATGIQTIYSASHSGGKSPGTRYTHYKPKARVGWLDRNDEPAEKALIVLHTNRPPAGLESAIHYEGDFHALARDLYDIFRTADHQKKSHIFIEALPSDSENPLLLALRDRIERASGNQK